MLLDTESTSTVSHFTETVMGNRADRRTTMMNLANSHDVHCLVPANMGPWIKDLFLEADVASLTFSYSHCNVQIASQLYTCYVLFTVKMDDDHWSLITTFNPLIK